jgi:hypothetical protein
MEDYFGLDRCQARLYTAIRRHLVLVMAALAICAVTAARQATRIETHRPLSRNAAEPRRAMPCLDAPGPMARRIRGDRFLDVETGESVLSERWRSPPSRVAQD